MGFTWLHAGHALTDALDDGAGLVAKDAGELAAHGHHKREKGDTPAIPETHPRSWRQSHVELGLAITQQRPSLSLTPRGPRQRACTLPYRPK